MREGDIFAVTQKVRVFCGCGATFLITACFLYKTTPKAPKGKPAGVNILLPLLLLGGGRI